MAVLSETDRKALWEQWMQENRDPVSVTKPDLRAAVDATEAWVDANMASLNAAMPQPAQGALSARQKASLLLYVVRRRWEVS